jgi:phosphatidylglycerol---prolipoprotein diacylglyceryl transferase
MILCRAYATIWDFINSVFGTHIASIPPNTYGFFMALAFIAGIIIARNELARKTKLGIFERGTKEITIGQGIQLQDLILYGVFGFIIGLKLIGFFTQRDLFIQDPQGFILSGQGSVLGGIIFAIGFAAYIAYLQTKEKLEIPLKKMASNNIEDKIGDVLIISMIGGVVGSKIMDAFDNPESMADFLTNPIASLTSGLSILGGLLTVSILLIFYAWKNKIKILPFIDSLSPPFFLSYAIGRLGCQFAGDGCWGLSTAGLTKPSWLPDFLWGNYYPHNVNRDGIPMENCLEPYCMVLPEPHLPTPLYETLFVGILFLILWSLRKSWTKFPGAITGLFLVFNGLERFLIEFVRVNTKYAHFGYNLSQAQYISIAMILIGAALCTWALYFRKEFVIKTEL